MLNFCPKCRSFYADADLRFCLSDGVPLIAVGQNENLRAEGEEFISRNEQRINRETFRKQIRKVVSILITTILAILVISVLTINSWLYLNPETIETVKNETIQPEPQPSIQISAEPVPTDNEPSPEITATPTPEPSPTSEISPTPTIEIPETPKPEITPPPPTLPPTPEMPTPVIMPPPTPTGKVTPPSTPAIQTCEKSEEIQATAFIRNRYGGILLEALRKQESTAQDEIAAANNLSSDEISIKPDFSPNKISVTVSPDCQRAFVSIQNPWTASLNATGVAIEIPRLRRARPPAYNCEKTGSNWSCR